MNRPLKLEERTAVKMHENGRKHSCLTHIDEDTIIAGYGRLFEWGFEYPLPEYKIREIYGTTSWNEYLKNKS